MTDTDFDFDFDLDFDFDFNFLAMRPPKKCAQKHRNNHRLFILRNGPNAGPHQSPNTQRTIRASRW